MISYYDNTNGDLKLVVCSTPVCTAPAPVTLDATGEVGWTTSVALTSDNRPVISYYDNTNGDLKLVVCSTPACTAPVPMTLDAAGDVGLWTSVALTSDNLPVISYFDNTNQNLKLAVDFAAKYSSAPLAGSTIAVGTTRVGSPASTSFSVSETGNTLLA